MNRLTTDQLQNMASSLRRWPSIIAVYCFGSQSRGDNSSPRDIDIAVLAESRLSLPEILTLRRELSLAFNTDRLDVVDLRSAGPVLKRNVIACEMRFYCSNESAANEYELKCLSEYRDSAHRRRLQTQILRGEYVQS